ncbi:GNAT family N-acetyltransferase [Abyssalbus ytuae]|uniref:N-acetyltransferase family protein n=1 Tax=Abyssalbus ytuae TaxID=2926907 RepID=A0A9E7A3Q1_9FLAO|nr:GNAT family N-acetyltransferase [Abyssalbus ytuae]UOB19311.1 N-acetyltransferase family protein [Abyssalbus ytuae]
MIIRNALEEDIPHILNIINEAIINTTSVYDYAPRTLQTQTEWFNKKINDNMPVVVGEIDGKVIAFGSYGIFRPWEGYRFSVEHSVYVDKNHRGKGLGKKLLKQLIEKAKLQGYHTMIAGIDATNLASISLHEKFGFKEAGRFKEVGHKFNTWLDLVFMQLML